MLTRAGQGICVFVKYWCCSCWQTALFKATTDAFVCFLWVEKMSCILLGRNQMGVGVVGVGGGGWDLWIDTFDW